MKGFIRRVELEKTFRELDLGKFAFMFCVKKT